ncbi:MAG: glutathione S-transferase family protein [Colwellia sp.]|nr:glutathione S-transferase family protein [Colwellia sp.]
MYKLTLTYFDFPGGRGEPARLAMTLAGIEFEDFRFPFADFNKIKEQTPLKQVPTLTVDGRQVTQNNAINRFVGKMAGLYPENDYQALLCDEIMDGIEAVTDKIVQTFGLSAEKQKLAREALVDGPLTQYLKWTQERLVEQGGEYFIESRMTIADLKVFVWIRSLNSGHLDHVPRTLVADIAPKLNEHMQRVAQTSAIAEYYSS